MAGVILENISTKKLVVICMFLLSLSLFTFIFTGVKVPTQIHHQTVTATWCIKETDKTTNREREWYYSRGEGHCDYLDGLEDPKIKDKKISAKDIIFAFQYPLPRDNQNLAMDRWFMSHVAVLSFNIFYTENNNPENGALIGLEVSVGYTDGNGTEWETYVKGDVERQLTCEDMEEDHMKPGYMWNCQFVDLFEVGSMHHKRYLVNIKMPPNSDTGHNMNIGHLEGVDLVWFAQTGGFTIYFLVMKTICFAMILPLTAWNWKRVVDLKRPLVFLEKLLLALACGAILMNMPIDWFVAVVEMKFLLLWSDIRQGLFLSLLLCYWLVFTGEHMIDDVKRGQWTSYWKHLATVIMASSLMFIFDLCERGVRLVNPFFSLWSTNQGQLMGKAFIGIAMAAGILYFIILMVFIAKAIYNIWQKRKAFKSMAKGLRIHYMSIIYRFFFTLMFTGCCSMMTVIAFIMGQLYESQWKWDFDYDDYDAELSKYLPNKFDVNTAFQLGVYAMWNVYVMAMLIFYAPSHKASSNVADEGDTLEDDNDETVELTAITSNTDGVRTRTMAASASDDIIADDNNDETTTLTGGSRSESVGTSQIHTLALNTAAVSS